MADLVGHTLGKYQLVERLGRGGMADVYKGYQPGLDRYVAVKVLHPHLSEEPNFITRFQREAKSVARLHHPHIVQVFDFDVQDDRYYMVMEYVEGGQTLKELLQGLSAQKQRLPQDQTLDIVAKIADALDYAHSQGMIHRDIKPSNILLRSLNQPILGDFGIARIIGQTGLTGSGAMIGTPAYISPEQGRGEQADERSDLYALGIVLYEMLTGVPPYDADTPYGVILKHINDPIVPPGALVGTLLSDIEKITLKSLAKNPLDRYQSAGEMRDALRKGLENISNTTPTSVATPPMGIEIHEDTGAVTTMPAPVMDDGVTLAAPSPAQSSKETKGKKRSNWWIWGTAGLALIVVLGMLIVVPRIRQNRHTLTSTRQAASSGEGDEDATVQSLLDQGFDHMEAGDPEPAIASFNQVLEQSPDNPNALAGRGMMYIALDKAEPAAADITRASEIAPDNPFVNIAVGMLHMQAEGYYDAGAAMTAFTKAVDGCGDNARLCSGAHQQRAILQAWDLGNPADAIMDMDQAIEIMPDRSNIAELHATRADMEFAMGDSEAGFRDFDTAYEKSQQGDYLERAASQAVHIENTQKALEYYNRLLNDYPSDPHYMVGQGYVQWKTGNIEAALDTTRQAVELQPDLPEAHYLLGLLYRESGKTEQAMAEFEPISQTMGDPNSYPFPFLVPEFGHEIFYDMAQTVYAMGDLDRTLDLCEQSIRHIDWPLPYILMGRILAERGEIGPARERYMMALDGVNENPELEAQINSLLAELSN